MAQSREALTARVQQLPRDPGVYLFKDISNRVIYVGKALDLRQRVKSYFQKPTHHSYRLRALVENIASLAYIVTDSEGEAFILEANLIKEYAPRYNVQFKDDKGYPFLRISATDPYPRLEVARKVDEQGYRYFGPYSKAGAMRETLRLIKKLFPLRSCRQLLKEGESRGRPCLNFQIKRCLGPCRGVISRREYAGVLDQVVLFLEGRQNNLLKDLERKMNQAAEALEYEKAARFRDQFFSLQNVMERQKVVSGDLKDRDVVALFTVGTANTIGLFRVRGGKLVGAEYFSPRGAENAQPEEIMKAFLQHYYDRATFIPGELLLSHPPEEENLLTDWLNEKRGKRVVFKVPQRGEKKALLDMVRKNTELYARQEEEQAKRQRSALQELARLLTLPETPSRIEGFDISHFAGRETVGAMVVFQEGVPNREEYRRFKIRKADPSNDYAALAEMLARRLDNPLLPKPSLILLDGGKGQLSAGMDILTQKGMQSIPMASLAKEQEHIFLPEEKTPLVLPATHPALRLLQQVRDEAHRFAVSYGRSLTIKSSLSSFLESLEGIGPVRRKALLRHFGGLDALKEASLKDIRSVEGMDSRSAENLYYSLHGDFEAGEDECER